MKVKVHRWPVKVTGPRGKILERTAQPLETRELDAEWNKTKLVVFFGMGGGALVQQERQCIPQEYAGLEDRPGAV